MIFLRAVEPVESQLIPLETVPTKMPKFPLSNSPSRSLLQKKQSFEETTTQSLDKEGWNKVGKKNKVVKNSNIAIPNGSINLSDRSGIKVIYESEDSEEGIQHLLENEEAFPDQPILVSVAADLHPYNLFSEEKSSPNLNKEKGNTFNVICIFWLVDITVWYKLTILPKAIKGCSSKTSVIDSPQLMDYQTTNAAKDDSKIQVEEMRNYETNCNEKNLEPPPECHIEKGLPLNSNSVSISKQMNCSGIKTLEQRIVEDGETSKKDHPKGTMETECPSICAESSELLEQSHKFLQTTKKSNKEISLPHQPDKELSEYFEEQYDYEYDDLLVDDLHVISHSNLLPSITVNVNSPIMISEDPPFSERDLEEFINNDEIDGQLYSEGTFHSMQNSIHSTSSFVNGMERLLVHQSDKSNSNSSKRRVTENVEDTATSEKRAVKKTKY